MELISLEYFCLNDLSFLDARSLTSTKSFEKQKQGSHSSIVANDIEESSHRNDLVNDSNQGNDAKHENVRPVVTGALSEKVNDKDELKIKDATTGSGNMLSSAHIRPLDKILKKAGVDVTEDLRNTLPEPDGIERLYGGEPVILGLEKCEMFQNNVPLGEEFLTVAGMFNTGTNLLEQMLRKNCRLPHREAKYGTLPRNLGVKYQVPWGKHSPISYRGDHVAPGFEGLNPDYFMPALVVKDPYTWMDSMCRHKYAANWRHFGNDHCPNLVATTNQEKAWNEGKDVVAVNVHYRDTRITKHTSMAHLWNDYYGEWMKTEIPKLVVRFEDLLFHPEEVVTKVCECGRGKMRDGPFRFEVNSAKKGKAHEGSNGLVRSMVKYATASNRLKSLKPHDLEYAMEHIDKDLMQLYHYSQPSL